MSPGVSFGGVRAGRGRRLNSGVPSREAEPSRGDFCRVCPQQLSKRDQCREPIASGGGAMA